jgi:ABC-2 type transport system permease protein
MKKIIAIAIKDTLVRFASPSEWLFFVLLPILFTVILGSATGSVSDSRVRLPVVDQAQTELSGQLISELQKSSAVRLEAQTLSKARSDFDSRKNSAVLIIPADFKFAVGTGPDSTLTTGKTPSLQMLEQPNNMDALISEQAVQAAVSRISSLSQIAEQSAAEAEKIQPFASADDRQTYYDAALKKAQSELEAAPSRLTLVQGNTRDTIEYDPRANSSAGQLITWVFIPLLGLSGTFAYERQQGTLRRILTTPTRKSTYLIGTITGQVLTALVQMAILIGFGMLVLHVKWGSSPLALFIMMLASALAAAAMGTMLGAFVKTESQASGLSVMLGMVMALLGGCWYPLELFPQTVRTAVKILPTTWSMQGMLDIVLRCGGVSAVLPEAGVLLGFAVVFFTIGVLRFRYE